MAKRISAISVALAVSAIFAANNSLAATIYDNFTSASYTTGINNYSYSAVFRSDINQTIGGIGGRISAPVDGDLKFVIFDLGSGGVPQLSGSLVFSQQKHFLADAAYNYKVSDPFSFSFLANKWYAVGAIANANFSISYDSAASVSPGTGFTAYANKNVNFNDFATLSYNGGFGCCNIHYQLYSGEAPEPATIALIGLGLLGVGFGRRKKVQ